MKKLALTLLLSSPVFANELTLYVVPSPGIDWSSPKSLFISTVKSKFKFQPHFMGHMWVDLKCGNFSETTGMTDENPDYIKQLFFNGRGLGILFHSFPGRLEDSKDVTKELTDYFKNGGINFVRFTLSEGQCKRARQYLTEYREKNVGRHYGLVHRPRHGEGAGCSAFATSVPDVLNILDQEMKEGWTDTVFIPMELAGPPVREESVSVFKIWSADKWALHTEKHIPLTFWNPDKIYKWINEKISRPQMSFTVSKIENIQGIVFDKSHFPVPQEPIWMQQLDPKDQNKTVD